MASISITQEEYLNLSSNTERKAFVIGADMEKVLEAGYSGEDFGGGRSLLLDFKGVGPPTDPTKHAKRCHVLIVHEAAVSITDAGCSVSS